MSDAVVLSQQATMLDNYFGGSVQPSVVLNTNPSPPNIATMSFADIVEPTASWYMRATSDWLPAFVNSVGQLQVDCPSVQFSYSGSSASETIYGWAVVDVPGSGTPTLISQGVFSAPQIMAQSLNAVTVTPSFVMNPINLG
jgi:hypothetical protein